MPIKPFCETSNEVLQHIDPTKSANASAIKIKAGTSNLAIECAVDGKDWEQVMRQRAKEIKLSAVLGVPVESFSNVVDDNEVEDESKE